MSPKVITRVKFAELAEDMITDYRVNGKRSRRDLGMRLRLHILPFFDQRRAVSITTADQESMGYGVLRGGLTLHGRDRDRHGWEGSYQVDQSPEHSS